MKRGISLIELIVAMGIGLIVVAIASGVLTDTIKNFTRSEALGVVVNTAPSIRKLIHRYFDRGVGVAFTNQGGAAPAGYQVFSNGGMYLVSDLRECPAFNPGSSNIAVNQTEVYILCCNQGMAMNLTAPAPPLSAGTSKTVTSACSKSKGLSIEVFKGSTISKVCFENLEQMDVFVVGQHASKQTALYQLDFSANTGKTRKGDPIPMFNFRYGTYEALGNLNPLTVVCQ